MPFPIFSIPQHIRVSIVQKLDFEDFLCFHQSSKQSYDAAKNVKTRFTILPRSQLFGFYFVKNELFIRFRQGECIKNFADFPLRFEGFSATVRQPFSQGFGQSMINLLLSTNSMVQNIDFQEIRCSPEMLCSFVETRRTKKITLHRQGESFVFSLNIPKLTLWNTKISSEEINSILKDLLNGKRNIDRYLIETKTRTRHNAILRGIPNSDVTLDRDIYKNRFAIGKTKTHILEIYHNVVQITKCT